MAVHSMTRTNTMKKREYPKLSQYFRERIDTTQTMNTVKKCECMFCLNAGNNTR
ncbi:TPA: hypothetical protein HA251_00980 [Candidatus Woesearchaeota archaeon]|nr:hypothetical protein [Candidatus Woesearchaeota archaeon]